MERIEEKYRKEEISKKETIDLFEKLDNEIVENLERYISKFWDTVYELKRELGIVQEMLPKPPEFGTPIVDVIKRGKEEIRKGRNRIKSAKREFGILELYSRQGYEQEISDFLEEYKSGVIVAISEIGDDVRNVLGGKIRFEERNMGDRFLFIIGGQK